MFGKPVPPQQMQVVADGPGLGCLPGMADRMKQNIQAAFARPPVIEQGLFMGITQYINVGKTIKHSAACYRSKYKHDCKALTVRLYPTPITIILCR